MYRNKVTVKRGDENEANDVIRVTGKQKKKLVVV